MRSTTHPCKLLQNLTSLLRDGLSCFTFDNVANEIPKLASHPPTRRLVCGWRSLVVVDPDYLSANFGSVRARMLVGRSLLAPRGEPRRAGMSFHVGSNAWAPEDFHTALGRRERLLKTGPPRRAAISKSIDIWRRFLAGAIWDSVLSLTFYCRSLGARAPKTFAIWRFALSPEPGRGLVAER